MAGKYVASTSRNEEAMGEMIFGKAPDEVALSQQSVVFQPEPKRTKISSSRVIDHSENSDDDFTMESQDRMDSRKSGRPTSSSSLRPKPSSHSRQASSTHSKAASTNHSRSNSSALSCLSW